MGGECDAHEEDRCMQGDGTERNHLENLRVSRSIILKRIWNRIGASTVLICLRIGTGGGRLWMRQWTFGLHKMRGNLTSWGTTSFSITTLFHGVKSVKVLSLVLDCFLPNPVQFIILPTNTRQNIFWDCTGVVNWTTMDFNDDVIIQATGRRITWWH